MKNILRFFLVTAIFLFLVSSAESASLKFVKADSEVRGSLTDFELGGQAEVENTTVNEVYIVVRAEAKVPTGFQWYMCAGLCFPPDTAEMQKSDPFPVAGGTTTGNNLHFYVNNLNGVKGDIPMTIKIYVNSDPTDVIQTTMRFVFDSGNAVQDPVSSKPATYYPSPVRDMVSFMYQPGISAEFNLFDNSGHLVRTEKLAQSGNATIDVTDIPNGVYYYTIGDGIKMLNGDKLVIAH